MSDPNQPGPPPYPGSTPPPPPPGYGQPPVPPPPPPTYGQQPYGQPVGYGQQPAYGQPIGYPPQQFGTPMPLPPYAHWGRRVAATLLDTLILLPFYLFAMLGLLSVGMGTDEYGNTTDGALVGIGFGVMGVAYLALFAFALWNQVFRQGRTGASLGKQWMSIRVVAERDGRPIGAGLTFVRHLCHILDQLLCYIGYLWPLWDAKRQTFADKIMSTVALHLPDQP